jgi:hypothetical protein
MAPPPGQEDLFRILEGFPELAHDDEVDACSWSLEMLNPDVKGYGIHEFYRQKAEELHVPEPHFCHHATGRPADESSGKVRKMDGTEIADQIKKAELYEAVKQALMRLLDDPQVQQKILEILLQRIGQYIPIRLKQVAQP